MAFSHRLFAAANLLVVATVALLAHLELGLAGPSSTATLGVALAAGLGVLGLTIAAGLEHALHYADTVRSTSPPPARAYPPRPFVDAGLGLPAPPRPPILTSAANLDLGEEEESGPLPPAWMQEMAPRPVSGAPTPGRVRELAPVVPLRVVPEPEPSPPAPPLRVVPDPEPAPPPLRPSHPRHLPRPHLPTLRRARRQVVALGAGAAVRERDRLWLPLAWPACPTTGTSAGLATWLGALKTAAGAEGWMTPGIAVLAVEPSAAEAKLDALAGVGIDFAGVPAAEALCAALGAAPRSLAAPGAVVGDLLVSAATAVPTAATLDEAERLVEALRALEPMAQVGMMPLLGITPGRWRLWAVGAQRLEDEPERDQRERAALVATELDDVLVRLGLRPSAPTPRQLQAIATRVAALLSVGRILEGTSP